MVFIDMGLLIERMADTISAEEYGNRSSKILEDWGASKVCFSFLIEIGVLLSWLAIWISMGFSWRL